MNSSRDIVRVVSFFMFAAGARAGDVEKPGADAGTAGPKNIRIVAPYLGTIADMNRNAERVST